jgi:hypothetical protein
MIGVTLCILDVILTENKMVFYYCLFIWLQRSNVNFKGADNDHLSHTHSL